MKKNLLYKLSVLVAMMFLTITACQNEDAALNMSDEPTQAEYDALINTLKNNVNTAIDTRSATLTQTLQADIENFNAGDASLENSIIANAIELDMLDGTKESVGDKISAFAATPPSSCSMSNLQNLATDDFWTTDIVIKIHWSGFWYEYYENVPLVSQTNLINKFNRIISTITSCNTVYNTNFTNLYNSITGLTSYTESNINLISTLLGISGNESTVLNGINGKLQTLEDFKANKFYLEGALRDLQDVYEELIAITDALNVRLTQAEADIVDLQKRVAYIEEVEIPAIWEGMEFLYEFINDIYTNLDQRVTGLTFKPEYDFGGGLSNLILVRGLSEWESKTVEGGFGWTQKVDGSVYKGITHLTYNVSPANAKIDFSTLELVYTTTKIITRSNGDDLLKIINTNTYPITYENGVLTIPVVINADAYPLIATSYDVDATENIKVALKLTNEGYTPGAMPERPTPAAEVAPTAPVADTDDRSVLSSEYVTVWLGLFDGRIAKKDETKTDNIGLLFPTEIITADFLKKDCSETDYPVLPLLLQNSGNSVLNLSESILAVFNNEFEKIYSLPADFNFSTHTLSYELVDLGNSANGLVTLAADGKITVTQANRSAAAGKTLAVLVKANVGGKVHALGYVRVLLVGEDKELITISNKLAHNPITINCSTPVEFTVRNTVANFINSNILNNTTISNKTNITTAAAFYQKYTQIEVNGVSVTNPTLFQEDLIGMVNFEYETTGNPNYIKGTISNNAPLGAYTVVTTLKSDEYIPDIEITWTFSVTIPQLRPSSLLVNGVYKVEVPTASPLITAYYKGILNNAFQQQNGSFTYNYLNPSSTACEGFITPNFIFASVPAGYVISGDGRSISKEGVEAAVIEKADGIFSIRLIEGPAAWDLVGTYDVKVKATGLINGSTYDIYQAFSVYFTPPLSLSLPSASFSNYMYAFNFYAVGTNGANIIRTWDGLSVPHVLNNKETAKLLIDYYGINLEHEQSYSLGAKQLDSPIKLDLANITYAFGSSNTFTTPLSGLGSSVTVYQFVASDVATYYNYTTPIRYKLVFNPNGATLPTNLRISIPVTIQHRWGLVEDNLIIKVTN